MKDQDLIKSYFNDYYPDNKRYVYNESVGVTAVIFLFLLYLMTKAFSSKNVPVITKRIENDPQIPDTIIKNLENIKKIIIDHNPGKDLKYVFNLLDQIDDNLNLLKKESNMQKTVGLINDQLIKFLEYITELYAEQTDERKTLLFNELNKVLYVFGLSDIFEKLLKAANDNKQIKNDNKQTVVLSQKDIDGFLTSEEKEDIEKLKKSSDEEEEEEEEDNLSLDDEDDYEMDLELDPEEEENKKILHEKSADNIKLFISAKKVFVDTSKYPETKKPFDYIVNNINDFELNDLKELYLLLNKINLVDDFDEPFHATRIFSTAEAKLEEIEEKERSKTQYERLLSFFKNNNRRYFIKDFSEGEKHFVVKIDSDDYSFGTIKPISTDDGSNYYYLIFYDEDDKFEIRINPNDKENYRAYDSDLKMIVEDINVLTLTKVCFGRWNYSSDFKNINFKNITYSKGYEITKYIHISKSSETFIAKSTPAESSAREHSPSTAPQKSSKYYYCIKPEIEGYLFMTEIKGDFISFLKQIYSDGYFNYLTYDNKYTKFNINQYKDLKELILFDCRYSQESGKNSFFRKLKNTQRNDPEKAQTENYFLRVKSNFISKDKTTGNKVIQTTGDWYVK